jgi:CheY-like chemotaxis protein
MTNSGSRVCEIVPRMPFLPPCYIPATVTVDTIQPPIRRLGCKHAQICRVMEAHVPFATLGTAQGAYLTPRIRLAEPLGKARILLADDHLPFLKMVESLLIPIGEVVGSVSDGQSLFYAARRLNPDVIVTDISMPILSGMDASRQLSESGCAAKIIFLTVHSDADFVLACLATGAVGFVLKPRILSDLLHAVQEALAGRIFISPPFSQPAAS